MYGYIAFLFSSSADGDLGWFYFLNVMNKAVKATCAQTCVWTCFSSLWYMLRSGVARFCGNSVSFDGLQSCSPMWLCHSTF